MNKNIFAGVLIALLMFIGTGYGDPKSDRPPDGVQINADWVGKVIVPLEAKLVSCVDFFYDPKQEGKPKQMELRFSVDAQGNRGKFDESGGDVTITYPGGIRINECFQETLSTMKFPAMGKDSKHIFRFDITPEIEKAANVLRLSGKGSQG
jgi:hypothetical protein